MRLSSWIRFASVLLSDSDCHAKSLRKQEASGCRSLRSQWFTMIWVLGFNETLGTRMRNGNMRVVDVCLHHSASLMDDVVTITPPVVVKSC